MHRRAAVQRPPVAKVRIHDAARMRIHPSAPRRTGEDKSGNAGFRQAMEGVPATASPATWAPTASRTEAAVPS